MPTAAPAIQIGSDALVSCLHCGDPCEGAVVTSGAGTFCCHGCEAVFRIINARRLEAFYSFEKAPGVSQRRTPNLDPARFAALDDPRIAARVVEFDDGRVGVA